MKAKCNYCSNEVQLGIEDLELWSVLRRGEREAFVESIICATCSDRKAPRVTVLGVLACHVGHISGKVKNKSNVSRETIGGVRCGK